jgi:hypothetical protein
VTPRKPVTDWTALTSPWRGTDGLWSGAREVVTGVNLTRPSRHAGMGQSRQCLNGAGGWFARGVGAERRHGGDGRAAMRLSNQT